MPSGRLAVLPSGRLAVWPSGRLAVWPSGRLAVWPSGRLAVWPSGRLAVWPSGNRLLERLMSPSPKSQDMFASAFSRTGDFFRIFGIHTFYATVTLFNMSLSPATASMT